MCLRSAIYMSLLGKQGLQDVATQSARAAHAFAEGIEDIGLRRVHSGPFFNEFVWKTSRPAAEVLEKVAASGLSAGVDLSMLDPEMSDCILTCVTEKRSPDDVARLVEAVKEEI